MRKGKVLVLVAMVCTALAGASTKAQATAILALQEDAGPITVVASGASLSPLVFSGVFGDFSVTTDGSSSVNGVSSAIFNSTVAVANLSGGTHTLTLYAASQDYTLPLGPGLTASSGEGGSFINTSLNVVFRAFADAGNSIALTPITASFTNGPQVGVGGGIPGTFDTGEVAGLFTRGAGNFSLLVVSALTINGGGTVNFSSHEVVTNAPEPATVSMLGLGLVGLALARYRYAKRGRS